jgi:hypothetical protein
MEIRAYRESLILAGMIGITALAVARTGDLALEEAPPISLDLPDHVGAYTAEDIRFCQSEDCMHSFAAGALTSDGRCPDCGGAVAEVSLAERRILPGDTVIRRRQYRGVLGDVLNVSIVMSGHEHRSLHRPQQCLPAQGLTIEEARVLDVPLPGGKALAVMTLALRRANRAEESVPGGTYAYWFAGGGRETPYHLQRLWWMSADRVLRRTSTRWAYVAVATGPIARGDAAEQRLQAFIGQLHAALHVGGA